VPPPPGSWPPWLLPAAFAAFIAVIAALAIAVLSVPARAEAPSGSGRAEAADVNTLLRTNSEIFTSALRDSTGRADQAVAERERLAAQLERCQQDLTQRDEARHTQPATRHARRATRAAP
jgi:hypothetical protein